MSYWALSLTLRYLLLCLRGGWRWCLCCCCCLYLSLMSPITCLRVVLSSLFYSCRSYT
ncbi:hypothetical protein Taro_000567, partial [Colocasia esculenta]|nr:hypothetical protein [Colocasia esculenta]